MATATKTTTDAKTRSLELVAARGYAGIGPCSTLGYTLDDASGKLVSLAVRVASASGGEEHVVTYSAASDDATCDCTAASYGKACFHRGVGLQAARYVARRAAKGWPED